MEPKIREATPSAWLSAALGSWRISGDTRDFEFLEKAIGAAFKPARMPRLERYPTIKPFPQHGAERAINPGIERKAWRQLHEKAAGARTQRHEAGEEVPDQSRAVCQPLI